MAELTFIVAQIQSDVCSSANGIAAAEITATVVVTANIADDVATNLADDVTANLADDITTNIVDDVTTIIGNLKKFWGFRISETYWIFVVANMFL